MDSLLQDLRFALRAIRRAPVFSAIAIGCLAVGIGVNAAAFGVFDALAMRDYPGVQRQRELSAILISRDSRWGRLNPSYFSTLDWQEFQTGIPAFSRSGVAGTASVGFRATRDPIAARADFVSGGFFSMLGTGSAVGRVLVEEDDKAGAAPVAVLGYDVWQREFDGRADAIGKTVFIGGVAFSVVGVAPKGFVGLFPGELVADPEFGAPYVYLPLVAAPLVRAQSRYASVAENQNDEWLRFAGRAAPGVTREQILAQAQGVAARIAAAYPDSRPGAMVSVQASAIAKDSEILGAFAFVMAIPILILLVACANLANQLLARAVHRSREIAVRLSLGATRGRLVRQLLVETSVLAIAASIGGVVIARLITDALALFIAIPFRIPIDLRVFAFTTVLGLITAIVFGLVPALRATRVDLAQRVKEGAKSGGYTRSRLRSGLVVLQVTASVALLALAGVFMRGSQRSRLAVDENANRVLIVSTDLSLAGFTAPTGRTLQSATLERLAALPGVEAVALAPFNPTMSIQENRIAIAGDAADSDRYYDMAFVSGDWFGTHNTRPLSGRLFTEAEARGASIVVVVDEVAAARLWPHTSAIGQLIRIGEDSTAVAATVIGVIPTMGHAGTSPPEGTLVVPAGATYSPRSHFYIRTRGSADAMRGTVRATMRDIEPRLAVASVTTLGESLDLMSAPVRQIASGVGVMGIVAMLLAALGLSALLSFIVEQRRYEIGVRIALGAQSGAVTWMILGHSLRLSLVGIGLGILIAGASATMMRSLLFGLPPLDVISFAGSTAILFAVALLSSFVPARRASRVDPMVALRAD